MYVFNLFLQAEIWLRYAECLFLLDRVEDSAEAYSKVIELAPGHKIARLNLSVILQKLGRFDVALESLDQRKSLTIHKILVFINVMIYLYV